MMGEILSESWAELMAVKKVVGPYFWVGLVFITVFFMEAFGWLDKIRFNRRINKNS
ncbi:MAG TPA: hypothetical protein VEC17_02340 [Candidatus Binatia bacterium]|nr:hypothetical protein [Candidatus Binatia bacterium]